MIYLIICYSICLIAALVVNFCIFHTKMAEDGLTAIEIMKGGKK